MIKQQYDSAKQQFLALPKDMQEQTCNQAAEQLKQMQSMMGKKIITQRKHKTPVLTGVLLI